MTDNPFRASQLRPGRIPYLFGEPSGFEDFLRRWEQSSYCGAIVGPHGTGKSTLLKLVQIWAKARGWDIRPFSLRPDARWGPSFSLVYTVLTAQPSALITVDGFEQIPMVLRAFIPRACRLRKGRILVTTHKRSWLTTVQETNPTPSLATRRIEAVWSLEIEHPPRTDLVRALQSSTMEDRLRAHSGSVREVMFELFDECRAADIP